MTRARRPVRRAMTVHVVAVVLATIVVSVGAAVAATALVVDETRRDAATTATTIARPIVATFGNELFGATERDDVLADIAPFLAAGEVTRIKVWAVAGDDAVVVFSDEPRNEGLRRPFDPALAARLDTGEAVVVDVPDDDEHLWEDSTETLAVFVGFTDAGGRPMRVEAYVRIDSAAGIGPALARVLPPAVLGPLVLGVLTLPMSLRLARRVQQAEGERRELLGAALAASDRERRRLAERLHDGVIQSLSGTGMALSGLADRSAGDGRNALATIARRLGDDVGELRSMLVDMVPPLPVDGRLDDALRDLATQSSRDDTSVTALVRNGLELAPGDASLLFRVARELTRNALAHATPSRVTLSLDVVHDVAVLEVTDDGRGFDPRREAPDGHFGLTLIRQAVWDAGGRLQVDAAAPGSRVRVELPVSPPRREPVAAL